MVARDTFNGTQLTDLVLYGFEWDCCVGRCWAYLYIEGATVVLTQVLLMLVASVYLKNQCIVT